MAPRQKFARQRETFLGVFHKVFSRVSAKILGVFSYFSRVSAKKIRDIFKAFFARQREKNKGLF